MRPYLTLLASMVLLLVSCQKQVETHPENKTFKLSFSAEMPVFTDESTKSSVSYVVRLSWAKDDVLKVFNCTKGKMLGGELKADSDGYVTRFSGELTGECAATDSLLFIHSKGLQASYGQDYVSFDFLQQCGNKTSNLPVLVAAKACLTSLNASSVALDFKFMMALIQVNLNTIPYDELQENYLYYAYSSGLDPVLTFRAGTKTEALEVSTSPQIIVDEDSGESYEESTIFFFECPVDEGNNPTSDILPVPVKSTGSATLFLVCPQQDFSESRSVSVCVDGIEYSADFTTARINAGYNYYTSNKSSFIQNDIIVDGDEGGDVEGGES